MSDDGGFSESIGTMIFVVILIILAGGIFSYSSNLAKENTDYTPVYVYTDAEAVPALSAHQVWDADSVKIFFSAAKGTYADYENIEYTGTKNLKFFLYDPKGGSHKAVQSISMKDLKIAQGAAFYFYTTSDDISGQYHITNQYARISDDTNWGTDWLYPKPFAKGVWRVVVIDKNSDTIIANKEVRIS